jgi:hypothetical protein
MFTVTPEEATALGVPMRNWNYSDILSEEQLREKLDEWTKRQDESDDPRFRQTCQRMISQYTRRIDRLGGATNMRRLIQRLTNLGVFVEYRLGAYTGQRIRVRCEDGLARNMTPGTAKIYADRLEAREWGFKL